MEEGDQVEGSEAERGQAGGGQEEGVKERDQGREVKGGIIIGMGIVTCIEKRK